jgi:hypothetical protein
MNYTQSGETSASSRNFVPGKDIPLSDLGALGAGTDVEATSRETGASTAPNYTQAGVKNIEAVSMSWTKWGLISAYARFVEEPWNEDHKTDLDQHLPDGVHNLA